jgi:hypothetical protein
MSQSAEVSRPICREAYWAASLRSYFHGDQTLITYGEERLPDQYVPHTHLHCGL